LVALSVAIKVDLMAEKLVALKAEMKVQQRAVN
jgi:hypothetical protein